MEVVRVRENEPTHGALMRALRRSWLTLLVCAVAGIVVMGIVHVTRGARYQAASEVYIAEQDLNALVLGVPITSDPQRDIANDLQLASSINFNQAVAQRLGWRGYDYRDVESDLSVSNSGQDDILTFTATGDTGPRAVELANTAVTTYDAYRAQVLSQPILTSLSAGGHSVTDAQRLQLIARLNQNAVVISRAQTSSRQAGLAKDLGIGLIVGLVVGLLIMAAREAVPVLTPDPDVAVLRRYDRVVRRGGGEPLDGAMTARRDDPGPFLEPEDDEDGDEDEVPTPGDEPNASTESEASRSDTHSSTSTKQKRPRARRTGA